MLLFKVTNKISREEKKTDNKYIPINDNSIIQILIDRNDIKTFLKVSNSLVIQDFNGSKFIIVNYFLGKNNTFVVEDDKGEYWTFDEDKMTSEGYQKFKLIYDYESLFQSPNLF